MPAILIAIAAAAGLALLAGILIADMIAHARHEAWRLRENERRHAERIRA